MKTKISSLILIIFLFSINLYTQSVQKYAVLGDFVLESGAKIHECIIGYRTLGKLNENKSNIIIYPTWHGGTSEDLINIVSKNFLLDTNKFYIIAIDALGNGISSSPSNSTQQPDTNFPKFTIRDMVNTQHYLLKNILGYEHIYGAIGGSMGGMQLFEWAVFYPSYIEKILPYVGTPQTTSYDLLIWNFQHELINSFHKYEIPEIELNKFLNMLTQVVGYTGEYRNEKTKREDFYKYFESLTKPPSKVFTIMNKNYQMMAMITHDVSKYFDSSLEKAAKNVKSKMLIIVNKRDLTVNSQNAEVFARYADCELMLLDNKCGHIIMSCEMERIKTAIHNFFNK